MFKKIRNSMLFALVLAAALATTASANIVLDLDTKEGDQNIRTKPVQPGDTIEIELIAQKGAQGIAGFEVVVKFDSQKFTYKDYQKGGLMAAAFPLPAAKTSDGVRISVGILGGQSTQDSGSLCKIIFEATSNVGTGGIISVTEGSFGAAG
ncbi:MAG: cohesin domain-containing protein, partial [Candidatus Latescibacterota bacterium]